MNQTIWPALLQDFLRNIEEGHCTYMHIYKVLRAIHVMLGVFGDKEMLEREQFVPVVEAGIEYLVLRGYDSDDLAELGRNRVANFIAALSELAPGLKNDIFFVHVRVFLNGEVAEYEKK